MYPLDFLSAILFLAAPTRSQSLGNAGTVEGFVADPSGAAIAKAEVNIHFLSTFSGTHFLQRRTVVAHIGLVF